MNAKFCFELIDDIVWLLTPGKICHYHSLHRKNLKYGWRSDRESRSTWILNEGSLLIGLTVFDPYCAGYTTRSKRIFAKRGSSKGSYFMDLWVDTGVVNFGICDASGKTPEEAAKNLLERYDIDREDIPGILGRLDIVKV